MQNDEKNPAEMSHHELLHTLWTKAVGTEGYIKKQWGELALRIEKLKTLENNKKTYY